MPKAKEVKSSVMKQESPVWEQSLLGFQQVRQHEISTADVHLICPDGLVPAHTFVLGAVSPFFNAMFTAQGDFYFGIRPVLLPDYKCDEIRRMIQFIYSGSIRVHSENEATAFKEFLNSFKVKMDKSTVESLPGKRGRPVPEPAALTYAGSEAEKLKKVHINPFLPASSRVEPKFMETKKSDAGNKAVSIVPKRPVIPNSKHNDDSDNDHISSTDTSENEMDDELFKDTEWFLNESKRCQKCRKQCKTAAAASMCLTSHNRLRCYFCFKVVRNTEKLFNHFAKRHKKAGRENCLMCPFCEQTVPFKSVSCHVISLHLADPRAKDQQANKTVATRPVTVNNSTHGPASKKPRQDNGTGVKHGAGNDEQKKDSEPKEYKLQNLEIVLRNRSITGKIRVITVKKDRTCPAPTPVNT